MSEINDNSNDPQSVLSIENKYEGSDIVKHRNRKVSLFTERSDSGDFTDAERKAEDKT